MTRKRLTGWKASRFGGFHSLLSWRPVHLLTFLFVLFSPTQLGKHWWPEWSLVRGIRVDYLSPTLYVTDVLFFVLLASVMRHRMFRLFPFSLFLLPFTLFAPRPLLSLYWLVRYLEIPLIGYLAYLFAKKKTNTLYLALSIGVFFSAGLGTFQMVLGKTTGLFWMLGERTFNITTPGISTISLVDRTILRPYATFPHPNALAGWLAAVFFLLPLLSMKKTYAMFARVVALAGVVLSASRTAIIAVSLALVVARFPIFQHTLGTLVTFPHESVQERVLLAHAAWRMFLDHPFFGVGSGQFIPKLPAYLPTGMWILQPVHNVFLLLLSEFGVAGTSIGLIGLIRLMRQIKLQKAWMPLLIVILVTSMGDHYWLTAQQNRILLGIILGIFFSTKKKQFNHSLFSSAR